MIGELDAVARLLPPSKSIICEAMATSGLVTLENGVRIRVLNPGEEDTLDLKLDQEASCLSHTGTGFHVGYPNGQIDHVSHSGVENVLTLEAPITKIAGTDDSAWALDEEGLVTWFDKNGNYRSIEGMEEIVDICHHGRDLAATGAFGGLYMITGHSIIHSSIAGEGSAEVSGPFVFLPSGVLVAYRRSLDEISDERPENRLECWSTSKGLIHTHEVDSPVASITSKEGGVAIGDELGFVTSLRESGHSSNVRIDQQKVNLTYYSDGLTLAGAWFHVYGIRDGEVRWKAEFDGMPSICSKLEDGRIAIVCKNPSNGNTSIHALDPNGEVVEEIPVAPDAEGKVGVDYEIDDESRFEHPPGDASELLNQMVEEVSRPVVEEEEVDLLVELSSTARKINLPPVADAGEDRTLKSDSDGTLVVLLDGSRSYDPDGDIATFEWVDERERVIGRTPSIKVRLGQGTHPFTLRVTDDKNSASEAIVTIRIT